MGQTWLGLASVVTIVVSPAAPSAAQSLSSNEEWCRAMGARYEQCIKEQREAERRDALFMERAKKEAPAARARLAPVNARCAKLDDLADGIRCSAVVSNTGMSVLYIYILDPFGTQGEKRIMLAIAGIRDLFAAAKGDLVYWGARRSGVLVQRLCGDAVSMLSRCPSISIASPVSWDVMNASERERWAQVGFK